MDDKVVCATELVTDARVSAEGLVGEAFVAALESERTSVVDAEALVIAEREAYRARASLIVDEAIADADRLLVNTRERAMAIEDQAQLAAAETLAGLEHQLTERQALVSGRIAALERDSSTFIERAEIEADDIRGQARAEAEAMLTAARAERDALLDGVASLRADATRRLEEALVVATERGAAAARSKAENRLADAHRELEDLETQRSAVSERIESAQHRNSEVCADITAAIVDQADIVAGAIAQDALHSSGLKPETYVGIQEILDGWEQAHASLDTAATSDVLEPATD